MNTWKIKMAYLLIGLGLGSGAGFEWAAHLCRQSIETIRQSQDAEREDWHQTARSYTSRISLLEKEVYDQQLEIMERRSEGEKLTEHASDASIDAGRARAELAQCEATAAELKSYVAAAPDPDSQLQAIVAALLKAVIR